MDDDDKANLARQGMKAAELLEPGKIGEKVKGSVTEAAEDVALRGIAAIGRLTGKDRSLARARAVSAVDLGDALASWDAADAAEFEQRVHAALADKAQRDDVRARQLSELRRSFPEPAHELALLVFNCVDLLEDLSEDAEGTPPAAAELEKKERLLSRLGELLAPNAGPALESFVAHVVSISRRHRGA
jgi:hypothetical protein